MTQQGTKSDNLRSSPRMDMVEGETGSPGLPSDLHTHE